MDLKTYRSAFDILGEAAVRLAQMERESSELAVFSRLMAHAFDLMQDEGEAFTKKLQALNRRHGNRYGFLLGQIVAYAQSIGAAKAVSDDADLSKAHMLPKLD